MLYLRQTPWDCKQIENVGNALKILSACHVTGTTKGTGERVMGKLVQASVLIRLNSSQLGVANSQQTSIQINIKNNYYEFSELMCSD